MFSSTLMCGNKRVVLEDGVDVAVVGRQLADVVALQQDRSAGRRLEAGDHPQDGRLAASRWPEQREELALVDLQVDVVDGHHFAEALAQPDELDGWGCTTRFVVSGANCHGFTHDVLRLPRYSSRSVARR